MGINIPVTMGGYQFENKEALRNAAKNILSKNGASQESINKIIDETIFKSAARMYPNAQLTILQNSSQISINNTLKETQKYLKKHNKIEKKEIKTPVLGELWNILNKEENKTEYFNDDIEIDYTIENIFAAA